MAQLDELPPLPSPDIPLPAGAPPLPAAAAGSRQLPVMPLLFVAAFAFLLASFPARNSDIWLHLAAGRQLVQGPERFDALMRYPLNPGARPAWLYDVACYAVYSVAGGAGLVVAKALLVVALAFVVLRLSRTGPGWALPVACTALTLLAMSIRLLLQPATVSYLLLALTLWFLRPREAAERTSRARGLWAYLPPWPLLLLFLVWANVDSWFLLGLATVALVQTGRALDAEASGQRSSQERSSFILSSLSSVLCLVAVCLLNPAHIRAFTVLPPELASLGSAGLAGSSSTLRDVMSPFQGKYLTGLGRNPAGLAYFPLLGMGMLAFVLNFPRWRWQWFLPWAGLALLSAFQVRTVPFFAVVAGPVLAWNLREWLITGPARATEVLAPRGRLLAGALALACLVCAWPGWLQSPPFEPRRWAVESAPSLERGAQATRRWYQENKLGPDAHGLHLSLEAAAAFAWFCPEENGVLDDGVAAAIVGDEDAPEDWAERLRTAGVNHVIVYDPSGGRAFAAFDHLLADPNQWPLLYLEGDLAVFGWRDPTRPESVALFRGWERNVRRLAFHPPEDRRAPRKPPEHGDRHWWEALWTPAPARSVDRDEARLHLLLAGALRPAAREQRLVAWARVAFVGLAGSAAGWTGPAGLAEARLRLALFDWPPGPFLIEQDDTPPALLYLTIRAARRAIAANPDDAQAYLVLGEGYLALLRYTREWTWQRSLPELGELRRAQASWALNRAALLKPSLAQAHLRLYELYRELDYRDLALKHLRTYHKLTQQAGPPTDASAGAFLEAQAQREAEISQMTTAVQDLEKAYDAEAFDMKVAVRAEFALRKGLAGRARDLLLESDVSAFGIEGMKKELELLLGTGQAKEVCTWTEPQQASAVGENTYHWLRAQAFAALGDYEQAEQECVLLAAGGFLTDLLPPRAMVGLETARFILNEQPLGWPPIHAGWTARTRNELYMASTRLAHGLQQEADATVLRGLLAQEEGRAEEAEVAFSKALALWKDEAAAAALVGLDFRARVIAQACLEWFE